MEQIIDQILEMHRIGIEIDKQVPTCCMGELYEPRWHISGYKAFKEVAIALNNGNYTTIDTGSAPFRYRCEFVHRGVRVFCVTDEEAI